MQQSKLQSTTAIFLSAWLGFLACLLGCARPAFASPAAPKCPISEATNDAREAPDSCCEHHKRPGAPEKNGAQPLSCCPLNATLHKQITASAAAVQRPVALARITIPSVSRSTTFFEDPAHHLESGRDLLLQSRVLRI
jgi:hypothetical protein